MTEGLHELKRRVVLEPENQAARFALAEALFGEKRYGEAATHVVIYFELDVISTTIRTRNDEIFLLKK